jgi:hypothetical protein
MASIGGLAAVYYAMAAVKQGWLFAVIVIGGLLVVFVIWSVRRIRSLAREAKGSTLLRERLQVAEGRVEDLKRANARLGKLAHQQYLDGIEEGRELVSSEIGGTLYDVPKLIALTLRDGKPLLIAELEEKSSNSDTYSLGATRVKMRYSLVSTTTQEIKGVVKVVEVDKAAGRAYLQCIQELVPPFWKRLTEVAATEEFPTNLALSAYSRNDIGVTLSPGAMSEILNPKMEG